MGEEKRHDLGRREYDGCDYQVCPAKTFIDELKANEAKHSDKVERLSTKIDIHMARSDEKHNQVIEKLVDIADGFKSHTDEEMKHQGLIANKIESFEKKQLKSDFRQNILWSVMLFFATGVGGIGFYMLKDMWNIFKGG